MYLIHVMRDVGIPGGYSHYGLTGGSGLFEGPAKDYQVVQFREITLPLGGTLVVTTLTNRTVDPFAPTGNDVAFIANQDQFSIRVYIL